MSNEMPKLATDPAPCVPEAMNSNPENIENSPPTTDIENIVNSTEKQNESMHGVTSEISCCASKEILETPTKEVNTAITESPIISDTLEKLEEKLLKDNTISEVKQNEQSPDVPEMQKQPAIGAGDTCFIGRRDESDSARKLEQGIALTPVIDQIEQTNKSPGENDKKETENEATISKLKEKVQKAVEERDAYQKQLKCMEEKLATLQKSYDTLLKGDGDEMMLRRMIEQLKDKLIQTSLQLEDRIRIVNNQEKQISALNSQVASLKEVESLTRSLLQIRNMEVKHLQAEVDDMEVRISEERERYNTMINKMDAAVKLNADLKKEYETQLCLFRDLREKYEEKVTLLSEEKRALEATAQSVPK